MLRDWLGHLSLVDNDRRLEAADDIAGKVAEVLELRTSSFGVDIPNRKRNDRNVEFDRYRMRTRFAVAFGTQTLDEGGEARIESVSTAFNSPVLAVRPHFHIDRSGGSGLPSVVSRRRPLEPALQPGRLGAARGACSPVQGSMRSDGTSPPPSAPDLLAGWDGGRCGTPGTGSSTWRQRSDPRATEKWCRTGCSTRDRPRLSATYLSCPSAGKRQPCRSCARHSPRIVLRSANPVKRNWSSSSEPTSPTRSWVGSASTCRPLSPGPHCHP